MVTAVTAAAVKLGLPLFLFFFFYFERDVFRELLACENAECGKVKHCLATGGVLHHIDTKTMQLVLKGKMMLWKRRLVSDTQKLMY